MLFSNCCHSGAWNDKIHEEEVHGMWKKIGICLECKEHCEFITEAEYDEELTELYKKEKKEMDKMASGMFEDLWKDFEKLREKDPSLKDMVDTQGKLTTVGGQKTDLMLENIWGTFPETAEVTDTGKRTADDWESANTNLSQVLENAMTDTGDPMADAQVLNNFMRKSLQTAEVGFDAKGLGSGDVYTYAPSAQLGTFKGPGGIQMSRDIYINMLKEAIHLKSEEEAQNIANQMFINMVTSLPR